MKLDNVFELSYCINLLERTDRWEKCQDEFQKINFFPKRFDAIKNANGAIGCYLSHLTILKEALSKNKNVLIFEDDVEFFDEHNCRNIIENAMNELCARPWHMIYFGGNVLRPFYQTSEHLGRLSHCQSTHAMGINKEFLPFLVEFLEKNNPQRVGLALDQLYADYIVPNNLCYMTIPMVAIQRSDFSTIENREMTYEIPTQRYWHYLVKNEKL